MQPQLASVLFRFRPASGYVAAVALLNQRIGDSLLASGSANVGVTEADGVTCLKLTLLNPTVCLADVKILLESVKACGLQLALVEESASAAASLEEQAGSLQGAVSAFNIGNNQSVPPAAAQPFTRGTQGLLPAVKNASGRRSEHNWEAF